MSKISEGVSSNSSASLKRIKNTFGGNKVSIDKSVINKVNRDISVFIIEMS
jgi:hypothetical protein